MAHINVGPHVIIKCTDPTFSFLRECASWVITLDSFAYGDVSVSFEERGNLLPLATFSLDGQPFIAVSTHRAARPDEKWEISLRETGTLTLLNRVPYQKNFWRYLLAYLCDALVSKAAMLENTANELRKRAENLEKETLRKIA